MQEEDQADIILVSLGAELDPLGLLTDAQNTIDRWTKTRKVLDVNWLYEWIERSKFIGENEGWGVFGLTSAVSVINTTTHIRAYSSLTRLSSITRRISPSTVL